MSPTLRPSFSQLERDLDDGNIEEQDYETIDYEESNYDNIDQQSDYEVPVTVMAAARPQAEATNVRNIAETSIASGPLYDNKIPLTEDHYGNRSQPVLTLGSNHTNSSTDNETVEVWWLEREASRGICIGQNGKPEPWYNTTSSALLTCYSGFTGPLVPRRQVKPCSLFLDTSWCASCSHESTCCPIQALLERSSISPSTGVKGRSGLLCTS